jgi:hypothetical protein
LPEIERVRWAPKVRRELIWRLYQADARGICPRCGSLVPIRRPIEEDGDIACPAGCGWSISKADLHNSWRRQDLVGGNIRKDMEAFLAGYDHAREPQQKMRFIDSLLHAFHQNMLGQPAKPAAINFLDGKRATVEAFLDDLAYGPASTPGLTEQKERWRASAEQARRYRRGLPPEDV